MNTWILTRVCNKLCNFLSKVGCSALRYETPSSSTRVSENDVDADLVWGQLVWLAYFLLFLINIMIVFGCVWICIALTLWYWHEMRKGVSGGGGWVGVGREILLYAISCLDCFPFHDILNCDRFADSTITIMYVLRGLIFHPHTVYVYIAAFRFFSS